MAQRFTRKEIEARNRRDDAVIIIDNVVYDVTHFLDDHPGGVEVLLNNAGRDASRCFHDVGHSDDAKQWRQRFRLGEVVDEDRWEVIREQAAAPDTEHELTLSGLINVWAPPLFMGALAILAYIYLFS
ncbi:cytochrome b5-like [Epargyreus clarus]|uniref:cytochrome b5-like n=1 Tax=Epargyreus clarus TaxID=520877 RepID=UPI003C308AA3